MEQDIIKVCNEYGVEKEYKLLFTFDYAKDNNQYIVYTNKDASKNPDIFCSLYAPAQNGLHFLKNVEDKDLLKEVETYIKKYSHNAKRSEEELSSIEFGEDF